MVRTRIKNDGFSHEDFVTKAGKETPHNWMITYNGFGG